jgi:hypothetical protein
MRKLVLLGLGLVVASGAVVAQTHSNMTEKKVKADIVFLADTKVGNEMLKAGNYRVACDRETITFTPVARGDVWGDTQAAKSKVAKLPCKGHELAAPSTRSEAQTVTKDGVAVLDKLLLKGSTVEHVFN